jgi:hypothetical protein
MLQVFYLDVAYIFNGFLKCFRDMFQKFHLSSEACYKWFIWIFRSRSGVASFFLLFTASPWYLLLPALAGHLPPPVFLDADVRGGTGPTWARETTRGNGCCRGRLAVQALVSPKFSIENGVFWFK